MKRSIQAITLLMWLFTTCLLAMLGSYIKLTLITLMYIHIWRTICTS